MDWNGFEDPETRRIGKLASFVGVAHPKFCKEYVSRTDKACWKENCDDVETPENYELDNCELPAGLGFGRLTGFEGDACSQTYPCVDDGLTCNGDCVCESGYIGIGCTLQEPYLQREDDMTLP